MRDLNSIFVEVASKPLIIDSDNLTKIIRANQQYLFHFVNKFGGKGDNVYEILAKILFATGIKNGNGECVSSETLSTIFNRIRKEQ